MELALKMRESSGAQDLLTFNCFQWQISSRLRDGVLHTSTLCTTNIQTVRKDALNLFLVLLLQQSLGGHAVSSKDKNPHSHFVCYVGLLPAARCPVVLNESHGICRVSHLVVRTTQRRLSDLPVPSATVRGQWINELKRITPTPSTNRTIIILDLFLTILDYSWKSHCPNIIFFKERYKRLRSF